MTSLRTSPLDSRHRLLGARMAEFGGWEMPIQYVGVIEEHRACRNDAAVFDVSHLGTVRVRGSAAFDRLQATLTNDLRRIAPGRAQYTHLLDEVDAHVVDDIIVWWIGPDEFAVMPNASNTSHLIDALTSPESNSIGIDDVTASRAVIAVQGPAARERLATLSPPAAAIGRFHVAAVEVCGASCFVAGTGYTGEDGVEIQVPVDRATEVFDAVVATGVAPAGLGARDTLRLEAGLPLHGHELGAGITPLQANLGWVVRFDKGEFRGRAALVAESEVGVNRVLRGLALTGRQPAREGSAILVADEVIGVVTSGNFSPTLGHAIALGFVPPTIEFGIEVEVEVRGKRIEATIVAPPFVRR